MIRHNTLILALSVCCALNGIKGMAQDGDWKLYNPSAKKEQAEKGIIYSTPKTPQYYGPGEVNIYRDVRIDLLSNKYKAIHEENGTIDGYRIRLFDSDKKSEAFKEKSRFLTHFPDAATDVVYDVPRFTVVTGGYRTRLEASKWLNEYKMHFPDAYILRRQIQLPELDTEEEQ